MKKKTIIWEENTEPPKNYYWIKEDNNVYEFDVEIGDWIKSSEISYAPVEKTSDGFSTAETSKSVADAISAFDEANPTKATSTITIEEISEKIVLPETTHPVTLKGDFSQNSETVIESNGDIKKVTINNTGEEANVTIDLPTTSVTLTGNYNEVTVLAVSDNTLTVGVTSHIKKLLLKKGSVKVNNAFVKDCIDEVKTVAGKVSANPEVTATTASSFTSTPRVVNISNPVSVRNIAFGVVANGHYVFNNTSKVNTTYDNGGSILVRGGVVNLDIKGTGTWEHSGKSPLIWNSDKESTIRIYDGKFFATNHTECVYAENGTIEIYGGEFHNNVPEGQKNFLLNCKDANYKAGTAKIVVYGGKFYGFNPAVNASESSDESTNFVADDYKAVLHDKYYEIAHV